MVRVVSPWYEGTGDERQKNWKFGVLSWPFGMQVSGRLQPGSLNACRISWTNFRSNVFPWASSSAATMQRFFFFLFRSSNAKEVIADEQIQIGNSFLLWDNRTFYPNFYHIVTNGFFRNFVFLWIQLEGGGGNGEEICNKYTLLRVDFTIF